KAITYVKVLLPVFNPWRNILVLIENIGTKKKIIAHRVCVIWNGKAYIFGKGNIFPIVFKNEFVNGKTIDIAPSILIILIYLFLFFLRKQIFIIILQSFGSTLKISGYITF